MLGRMLTASLVALATSLVFVGSAAALDIADASPPSGSVGVPYRYTFSLSPGSGSAGASWSVSSGALPPGLALSSNDRTALVYGTPTQAGTFRFYLKVRDAPGPWVCCTEEEFSITIDPAFVISAGQDLPVGNVGSAYGYQLVTSGGTAQSWALAAGSLPAGMTLTPTGAIVGTPTQSAAAQFTVRAVEGSRSTTKQLTLKVTEPMSVTAPAPKLIKLGRQFLVQFTVKGGLGPFTWSGVGLPAGIGMNPATGQLGGRPTALGPLTLTVKVTDSLGATATANAAVLTAGKLALLTKSLPPARVGKAFRAALRTTGGAGRVTFKLAGSTPDWLRLQPGTATLSGTPKPQGKAKGAKRPGAVTYVLYVTATDALGQRSTAKLKLSVKPKA